MKAMLFSLLVFLVSCGHYQVAVAKEPSLLDVLCAELRRTHTFDDDPIYVVGETRPIFQSFALRYAILGENAKPSDALEDERRDEDLHSRFAPTILSLEFSDRRCPWRIKEKALHGSGESRELVLEISDLLPSPVALPGESPEKGRFVRLSLGGRMIGTWFWLGGTGTAADWKPSRALQLDIDDI
jgi:hypothetical protein